MAAQLIDIALGPDMDLYQDPFTGDFVLIEDIEALAQRIRIRLGTQLGEYFLDLGLGLDYFGEILVKNFDLGLISTRIKSIILSTPFVDGIRDFEISVTNRTLSVSMVIETEFGPLVAEAATSTVTSWMLVLSFPELGPYLR